MAAGGESSHYFSTEEVANRFVSREFPDETPSNDSECDDNQVDSSDPEAGYSSSEFDPSGDLGGHASMSSDDMSQWISLQSN